MIKVKRTATFALLCIFMLCFVFEGAVNVFAAEGVAVLSADATASDVLLTGSFNNWEGTAMHYTDSTTVSTELELEAGSFQFKIQQGDIDYGHPGTIKDTTVTVSPSGWTFSDSINAKCTFIATGGAYTFNYDTESHKLQVVKDGETASDSTESTLTVNYGGESVTANIGDTLTYKVYLSADKCFEDIQAILSYNEEKLSLVKYFDTATEAEKYCPNIADAVYNSDHLGVIAANASDTNGYDFTDKKLLLTFDFTVIGSGETSLEFTIQEMTAIDGSAYFAYSSVVNGGAVLEESLEITGVSAPVQSNLGFSSASLILQENLCINFKVSESLFAEAGYQNPYVRFEMNGAVYNVYAYTVKSGRYIFAFDDISPANMNDTICATLYATSDGIEYRSETLEYSVATYCYNMLSKYSSDDYAELRALLVDLLNYGGASQKYAGYNTDNLVNTKLTDEQASWGTSETPAYSSITDLEYKTIENPVVSFSGAGLSLDDSVTMRFKISAESYEDLLVKIEAVDMVWTIPASEFTEATGQNMYAYFSQLNSAQMREPVYVTVYRNGVAVSNTLSYSVESYVYSKQSSDDTALKELLEAMMKYGDSAYAYVN